MSKIRRGGYVFLAWKGDHGPRHVHVYSRGVLVLRWDLEHRLPMTGHASRRLRRLIDALVAEGRL